MDLIHSVALPVGLGLLGFAEPCSIGATLVFIKTMEASDARHKLTQVAVFTIVRALFMGALGVSAVWIGSALLGLQKSAWIALGALYALLGILYLSGQGYRLTSAIAPRLSRLCSPGGSAALGVLFAFNIPACAGPLLLALLGMTAAGGASGAPPAAGFVSLALFGLALSLPLVTAVLW